MEEEFRPREFNVVVGIRFSGKTTFVAEQVVKPYAGNVIFVKHKSNDRDPAVSFLPVKTTSNWRQGAKPGTPVKCLMLLDRGQPYREFLKWCELNYSNGLLVIDDCTIFENKGQLTKEMELIATMCRHLGIDVWLIYHGLTKLPIEQFIFVDHFLFFNTTDKIDRKKNVIPDFEAFEDAILTARINHQSADPSIKYNPVILKRS